MQRLSLATWKGLEFGGLGFIVGGLEFGVCVSPGVLVQGGQVLGGHRHIRRIHDLCRLDLIGTLAATAESMLEDEFRSPALLAAPAKRYRDPESKIVGWLTPPVFFFPPGEVSCTWLGTTFFAEMMRSEPLRFMNRASAWQACPGL